MADSKRQLATAEAGQNAAALLPGLYQELRKLATDLLRQESPGQTLQPTALVHEAFLRVIGPIDLPRWENRGHFFAAAAQAMRRILIDAARRKKVFQRIISHAAIDPCVTGSPPVNLLALDDALNALADQDSLSARVVELKCFVGLTIDQISEIVDVSRSTVKRKWIYGRAWLRLALNESLTQN